MKSHEVKNFILKHEALFAALLLLLGFAVRLIGIDKLPRGLNQDEASAAYEAWALLHYGVDRCGNAWPVLFVSWGSGQNVLYSYLTIPFVALFGLNAFSARIVAALWGCVTLFVFWRFARRVRSPQVGLAALLLLAVNPWHCMASRWGLESNLLPGLLLLGLYLLALSEQKPYALLGAAAVFALSLYAYGTAFLFLPPFLLLSVIFLTRRNKIFRAPFLLSVLVFCLIALPITLCNALNVLGGEATTLFGLTLPKLTETRQSAVTVFGSGTGLAENFKSFLSLLLTQNDGLPYNELKGSGMLYFFGLPLALLGFLRAMAQRKSIPAETPMLLALFSCFLAAWFIVPNTNRVNMVWLPLLYFSALGLDFCLDRLDNFSAAAIAGIMLCFALFLKSYTTDFVKSSSVLFYEGLGDCIEYAESLEPESIYLSNYAQQPYIFVLFYCEISPEEFASTVTYYNPDGAFRYPEHFGTYHFGFGDADSAGCELKILHWSEAEESEILASFGNYCVCKGCVPYGSEQ